MSNSDALLSLFSKVCTCEHRPQQSWHLCHEAACCSLCADVDARWGLQLCSYWDSKALVTLLRDAALSEPVLELHHDALLRVWVSVVSKCFGLTITPAKANCGKEEMSPTELLQQSHPIIAPHSNSVAFLKTDWLARCLISLRIAIFTCLWLWEPQFKPQFKN